MTDNPSTRELVLRAMESASIYPVLAVRSGPHEGATLALETPGRAYRVGRSRTGDLVLEDDGDVSREHLEVQLDDGEVSVRDLRTRHGTRLSGRRLEPGRAARWSYDAVVQIGGSAIELVPPAAVRARKLASSSAAFVDDVEESAGPAVSSASADAVGTNDGAADAAAVALRAFETSSAPAAERSGGASTRLAPQARQRGSHAHRALIVAVGLLLLVTIGVLIVLVLTFR